MKKHVIALGRQFGSGGREIGRKLSESLGFAYYDRELLKLAAERAEVGEELFADKDEKAGNPWLFKAFYQGGPKVKQGQSAEDVLFQMQSEIIRELAEKEDCLIVGRCADLVLTGQDVDCLSLFICAPFEWRVHHRMELENLDEKECLNLTTPMTKDKAVLNAAYQAASDQIIKQLEQGKDVACLTLGDPTIYSTYIYIHRIVKAHGYATEIINGIPSFCAVSAKLQDSLVDRSEQLHIIPSTYDIEAALELPGTKVLMKAASKMPIVKETLKRNDLKGAMIENCGMPEEHIYHGVDEIPDQASYYSIIVVKEDHHD